MYYKYIWERTYFFKFLHTITTKKYIHLKIISHNRGYRNDLNRICNSNWVFETTSTTATAVLMRTKVGYVTIEIFSKLFMLLNNDIYNYFSSRGHFNFNYLPRLFTTGNLCLDKIWALLDKIFITVSGYIKSSEGQVYDIQGCCCCSMSTR